MKVPLDVRKNCLVLIQQSAQSGRKMFAVVTLADGSKTSKCVPVKWIYGYDKYKSKKNKKVFCFISENLSAEPKFDIELAHNYVQVSKDYI